MSTATIDPMDMPEPEENIYRWGRDVENRVLADPWTPFTWDQIRADAVAEFESRITEFHIQKNSAMVDWMLENRERFLQTTPDDLLIQTQAFHKRNHESASILSPEEARVIVKEARGL